MSALEHNNPTFKTHYAIAGLSIIPYNLVVIIIIK
jgi:hypothetical protein